jgi:hypothetical protein
METAVACRGPHSTLDGNTQDEFYFANLSALKMAA